MQKETLIDFLNRKVDTYNQPSFIKNDPVCIPHLFSKKQDIEIAGFFAAIFAWGNRTTIINKSHELIQLMEMQPYEFCLNHDSKGLKRLAGFKHRTFTADDLYYFFEFFARHYQKYDSLETAFFPAAGMTTEEGLTHFRTSFFKWEHLKRTEKHVSSPQQKSTCKRLNMYLRWMVRNDHKGIDFGLWKKITPSQLICPVDVHVARVARQLGLMQRKQVDWLSALELTEQLRIFDPADPVKYDFALFGLGVAEKF